MNKKIIINGSFLTQPITGVQRFAIEICKEVKRLYPFIEVVAPQNIIHKNLADQLESKVIGRFISHWWEQIELHRYVLQQKAPLLNLDMRAPLLYHYNFITIHDLNFLRNPEWMPGRFNLFYGLLARLGSLRSRKIFTVSNFSKLEIIDLLNIKEDKVEVIYNAIPEAIYQNTVHNRIISGKYILSVSSTNPRKNLRGLIQAFEQLNIPDISLVLIGLPHKSAIEADYGLLNNDRIIFKGYVSDEELFNMYKYAEVFVYPSLYEGFGIPPLEAMQHGCPVVVSNVSSLPEICGDAAYYIDPQNINSISKGMYDVLTSPQLRLELKEKGYQRIKKFNWETSARKIIESILE